MISRRIKKVSGIQRYISMPSLQNELLPTCTYLLYKGYQPHYQWFQQNHRKIPSNTLIYAYDRAPIDICLEMVIRKTKQLTYISTRNYETVGIMKKMNKIDGNSQKQQQFQKYLSQAIKQQKNVGKKQISPQQSLWGLYLLQNYSLIIKSSYLKVHPLQCYQKICGYLNIQKDFKLISYFNNFRCSNHPLFDCFNLLPILTPMRQKYLITQNLKLKKLQRNTSIKVTPSDIEMYIGKWKQQINIQIAENAYNSYSESTKLKWVVQNGLGEIVTKEEMQRGKFRNYFYGTWS